MDYPNTYLFYNAVGGIPDWTGENCIYTACPDGIHPVCFKVLGKRD